MKKLFLLTAIALFAFVAKADEGMWLLKELNNQSIARMKELGFKFPTDKIYSETNPSLKDAVVIFGGGCTGVAVSGQGLVFTNHHCGYGNIQKLSSVEHDYLKDGFVSDSFSEELPAEGLTVSFLQKTEDITDFVTATVLPDDSEDVRDQKIEARMDEYLEKYKGDTFLRAQVIPFYANNKYYAVIYEVFRDVRLVFTPPSSIGKFGGETDNWMWPRHTGDFSVFRVFANKDNKPANYSPENVPYRPKYSVPISLNGYKENDYAMTIGYPGSTERYIPSWGIEQMVESEHKPRIEVRGAKQEIWKKAMNASDAIRIKYANKYAGSSNYWKNAMGMNEAIVNLNVIEDKKDFEIQFTAWAADKPEYKDALSMLEEGYTKTMDAKKIQTYLYETFYNGIEITRIANTLAFINRSDKDKEAKLEDVNARLTPVFKDYEPALDKAVMPVLLKLYGERVPKAYLPAIYDTVNVKFGGDFMKYADWLYANTKLTSLDGVIDLVNTGTIDSDPAMVLAKSLEPVLTHLNNELSPYYSQIDKGNRLYLAGLMAMQPSKAFYPDANFTQRLSYGSIGGYKPADAVSYDYFSTAQGVMNKQVPGDPEFNVQQYILDDIKSGEFGRYAAKDGKMYVNFLSNNDITGGNSGSPVFNGNAQLIGLAFDGNWESLSGDILFEPSVQRTISVDIRYVLYVIDKVMNSQRIIDELNIVK